MDFCMLYWSAYKAAILFSQQKYPSLWGGSSAFLAGLESAHSLCPGHFCSCSPPPPEPVLTLLTLTPPALVAVAAATPLQAGEKRRISPGVLFYVNFCFSVVLLMLQKSQSFRASLPCAVTQAGHLMRPFKIQGLILRQSKPERKIFTCNYFSWPEPHSAEQRRQHMASFWGKYCSCTIAQP